MEIVEEQIDLQGDDLPFHVGVLLYEFSKNEGMNEAMQSLTAPRFGTGKWKIFEGQFSCLKYLELSSCHSLKHWTTEASSIFPRLEKLTLLSLKGLDNIPYEIGDMPTLQKILMIGCRKSVVKCAKEIVEEQMDFQGDDLPFHVFVRPSPLVDNKAMQNLAGPNFVVEE
ncbi:hypothetical protein SASPL_106946 [Salvia splendens]|uniref:Disease resistance protein RPM1 n=1 Tax=Salvia splendens TaxID=180675 RepID=A0A8X9A4W0_SALSN|nr:hypothetical protein SASPL_106946 [Salvia splendens]